MPKLHVGFLFGQHPVFFLKLISQFHAQIRYPYYLPDRIIFGLDLYGIYFDPLQVVQYLILDNSIHVRVVLPVKIIIKGIVERHGQVFLMRILASWQVSSLKRAADGIDPHSVIMVRELPGGRVESPAAYKR